MLLLCNGVCPLQGSAVNDSLFEQTADAVHLYLP